MPEAPKLSLQLPSRKTPLPWPSCIPHNGFLPSRLATTELQIWLFNQKTPFFKAFGCTIKKYNKSTPFQFYRGENAAWSPSVWGKYTRWKNLCWLCKYPRFVVTSKRWHYLATERDKLAIFRFLMGHGSVSDLLEGGDSVQYSLLNSLKNADKVCQQTLLDPARCLHVWLCVRLYITIPDHVLLV